MPYAIRFSLFLLAALTVAGLLGYLSGFFGPWAVVLVILVVELHEETVNAPANDGCIHPVPDGQMVNGYGYSLLRRPRR